jgi:prolyl-tRNA synthetase
LRGVNIAPLESGIATIFAAQLYERLTNSKLDIVLDDSDAVAEEKLKYADLLGIPFQIVTSADLKCRDNVEIRERSSS